MKALLACSLILALAPLPARSAAAPDAAEYTALRLQLARDIEVAGVVDSATLDAMRRVPRHEFVLPADRRFAYEDHPLPIGHGQPISQPYIVAYMTEVLEPRSGMRVLEVGTGSGYQAAVLAQTGCRVFTIEIFRVALEAGWPALLTAAALAYAVAAHAGREVLSRPRLRG